MPHIFSCSIQAKTAAVAHSEPKTHPAAKDYIYRYVFSLEAVWFAVGCRTRLLHSLSFRRFVHIEHTLHLGIYGNVCFFVGFAVMYRVWWDFDAGNLSVTSTNTIASSKPVIGDMGHILDFLVLWPFDFWNCRRVSVLYSGSQRMC